MRTTILASAFVIGIALIIGSAVIAGSHRYHIVGTANGAFEVDGWNGRVWGIGEGKFLQREKESDETHDGPAGSPLPAVELAKITTGKVHSASDFVQGDIYNGSAWRVNRIVFSVTTQDREGATIWTRDYSTSLDAESLAGAQPLINSVWVPESATVTWTVKQAFGIPPKN